MKFLLKASYPCLVKTECDSVELDENDLLEIEDERNLFVYPISANQTPFCIDLSCPRESDFFSILDIKGQKVLFLERPLRIKSFQTKTLNFSGKNCRVYVGEKVLVFETDEKKLEFECKKPLKNAKIFKLKNFACVQSEEDFFAYSFKTGKLSHFSGDIKLDENVLSMEKKFHDSMEREKKAKYLFDEEVVVQDEQFVRNEEETSELVPFKLLESVKAKDYAHALSFLSEKLKKHVDSPQLSKFFGNFSAFLPLSTTEYIIFNEKKEKAYVAFSLAGGKVDDISIDAL